MGLAQEEGASGPRGWGLWGPGGCQGKAPATCGSASMLVPVPGQGRQVCSLLGAPCMHLASLTGHRTVLFGHWTSGRMARRRLWSSATCPQSLSRRVVLWLWPGSYSCWASVSPVEGRGQELHGRRRAGAAGCPGAVGSRSGNSSPGAGGLSLPLLRPRRGLEAWGEGWRVGAERELRARGLNQAAEEVGFRKRRGLGAASHCSVVPTTFLSPASLFASPAAPPPSGLYPSLRPSVQTACPRQCLTPCSRPGEE